MRKSKPLNVKDVPPVPAELAHVLQYPNGIDLNGKGVCYICGKKKPYLKLKHIGNEVFKCRSGRCKPKEVMSTPRTHIENVSKKRWIITIPEITIEVKEG